VRASALRSSFPSSSSTVCSIVPFLFRYLVFACSTICFSSLIHQRHDTTTLCVCAAIRSCLPSHHPCPLHFALFVTLSCQAHLESSPSPFILHPSSLFIPPHSILSYLTPTLPPPRSQTYSVNACVPSCSFLVAFHTTTCIPSSNYEITPSPCPNVVQQE